MKVHQGRSFACTTEDAVGEAVGDWPEADLELLIVFCSSKQDAGGVAADLAKRFPGVPMAGCTTAGEHLSGQHSNGSLVVVGITDSGIRWATTVAKRITAFDADAAKAAVSGLFAALEIDTETFDPSELFCLNFIDGLTLAEEGVATLMADALEGVQFLGGSAGDDLQFKQTEVIHDGGAYSDAAVFVLGHSKRPFKIIKHQHFTTTDRSLVITKADPAKRVVYEIDGYPAAEAYARALGIERSALTGEVAFLKPITFQCNNEVWVRSVQAINDDDSIAFYCAIEEGMVLDVGAHEDMEGALAREFDSLENVDFVIAFNCILRALEATGGEKHEALGKIFDAHSCASIGFDTYGEQLGGLHINQTLVAIAFQQAA